MDYRQQKQRYQNDPEFNKLVDLIYYHLFLPGQFSISEIRDAVTFAAIKFEHENVRLNYPMRGVE